MKKVIKIGLLIILVLFTLVAMGVGIWFLSIPSVPLNTEKLDNVKSVTRFIDTNGNPIQGIAVGQHANIVNVEDLSDNTLNAFICTEDKRFYQHKGVDFRRVASAMLFNMSQGTAAQGGSTITQQLAKNTHLSSAKTVSRKIQEMRLARQIEKKYSKRQILEKYFNAIYFGHNVYGLESASQYFFGTTAKELSVDQAACLAAVINAPARYSPIKHPDALKTRRDLVLKNMVQQKKLTESEYSEAVNKEIVVHTHEPIAAYYLASVMEEAKNYCYGRDFAGCTVYTGFDPVAQQKLSDTIKLYPNYRAKGVLTDMVGNIVAAYSPDASTVALKRQPGSVIKPIAVYAPAIERGLIAPATPIFDEATDFHGYAPKNFGGTNYGWISARQALASSNNIAAVKILEMAGTEYCFNFAKRLGLPLVDDDCNLSMALGGLTYGVTAEQIAASYTGLANDGNFNQTQYIQRIEDKYGKTIYQRPALALPTMSQETPALVRDMMQTCAASGTAAKLSSLPFDVAAKTGTVGVSNSENNSDAYCAGFTSKNAFCFWIGSEDNNALPTQIRGGTLPAVIANDFLRSYYDAMPPRAFENRLTEIKLDYNAYREDHALVEAPRFLDEKDTFTEKFGFRYRPSRAQVVMPTLSVNRDGEQISLTVSGDRYADYQIVRYSFTDATVLPVGKLIGGAKTVFDSDDHGIIWTYRVVALYPDGSRQLSDVVRVLAGR